MYSTYGNYFCSPCKFEKWLMENGPTKPIQSFVDSQDSRVLKIIIEMVKYVPDEFRDPSAFPKPFGWQIDSVLRDASKDIQELWFDEDSILYKVYRAGASNVWYDLSSEGTAVYVRTGDGD